MQHLIQRGKSWEYKQTGPAVDREELRGFSETSEYFHMVELEFDYDRAGTSMWTYKSYPGGIYFKVRPVKLEMENGRPRATMFTIGANEDPEKRGFSLFLIPMDRGNPSRLKQVAEFFDLLMPELGNLWFEKGSSAVRSRLKDAAVSFQQNHKLGSTMIWPPKEPAVAA